MKDVTFIRPIPVLHAERPVPELPDFAPVACIPRKAIRHVTSDSDVCEVDLDMQMSFLNAASCKGDLSADRPQNTSEKRQ